MTWGYLTVWTCCEKCHDWTACKAVDFLFHREPKSFIFLISIFLFLIENNTQEIFGIMPGVTFNMFPGKEFNVKLFFNIVVSYAFVSHSFGTL